MSSPRRSAQAVLFDLGDTLFPLHPLETASAFARFGELLAERAGMNSVEAQSIARALGDALAAHFETLYQAGSTDEPSVAATAEPLLTRFGSEAPGWPGHSTICSVSATSPAGTHRRAATPRSALSPMPACASPSFPTPERRPR